MANMDGQTGGGRTDGQVESYIPLKTLFTGE